MTTITNATVQWPTIRAERREAALTAIDAVSEDLAIGAIESEQLNRMSDRAFDALDRAGVFGIMTPDDLGGNVVDPLTAFEIIEKIGYIDPATAWTATILLEGAGELATMLQPQTASVVFADRLALKAMSLKPGPARAVDGGYIVSGRWDFVSGLHHAVFASATFLIDGPDGNPVRRVAVIPREQITILDDWRVLGMRGTGSSSFEVTEVFVPDAMVYDPFGVGERPDTPLAQLGMTPFLLQMHPGMVLGAARRAVDTLIELAPRLRRGSRINLQQSQALAEATWFQRELGELDVRVRAARSFCVETLTEVRDLLDIGGRAQLAQLDQMQTAASYAAKVSVEVVTRCFRHTGAMSIVADSLLGKLLRDLNTISAHGVLSEAGFETHAEFILGLQTAENRRMV